MQPDMEHDFCATGFVLANISPRIMNLWVSLQIVGLLFQWSLWREVASHLEQFESNLVIQCAPERMRHGVCIGPMWNVSYWEEVSLEGQGWHSHHHRLIGGKLGRLRNSRNGSHKMLESENQQHPSNASQRAFEFFTRSVPPTFLITVEPVSLAPHLGEPALNRSHTQQEEGILDESRWSLKVMRVDPPQTFHAMEGFRHGPDAITFEDPSQESAKALTQIGFVKWQANLTNRGGSLRQTRFAVYVEDSAVPHLADIHSSSSCSFARSWRAFNQQKQGKSHVVLRWCCAMLGKFLPASILATWIVYYFIAGAPTAGAPTEGCCDGFGFHWIIIAKFIFVDIPQQTCIVLYMLGWYETDGLRCQLCLFHPDHCEEEHPFAFANLMTIICTLLSSVSNQILVRPARQYASVDDKSLLALIRICAGCVSMLPFTTGVYWATSALLWCPVFLQVVLFFPCAIGWMTVFFLAVCWVAACCESCE